MRKAPLKVFLSSAACVAQPIPKSVSVGGEGGAWASGGYPDRYTQALPAGRVSDLGKRVNDYLYGCTFRTLDTVKRELKGTTCY